MNSTGLEINKPNSVVVSESLQFFTLADIARACSAVKRTVARTAIAQGWPRKQEGNKFLFAPPTHIATLIVQSPGFKPKETPEPLVTFAQIANDKTQAETTLLREKAVKLLNATVSLLGKEVALVQTCARLQEAHPLFRISVRSLRRWQQAYAEYGLDGLVEQKRGKVGKKPFAADLDEDQLLQLRADSVEHGLKGAGRNRTNTARAFRNLVASPSLAGAARTWAHGAYASKSYVPPSVRAAAKVPALAVKYIQQGPKAVKLDGPYTECSYENVPAGHAFTADDMTCNAYVWCEWPNEQGFLLIRPQLLAVMDIGSLAWLNFRVVMRPKGQYNKDDVWGTIGDTLDTHGLFQIAVLEGGTWQSDVIIGQRTGIDDETRFGGLRSLGVKVIHTRSPRGKIIEQAFHTLQIAMDNVRGYCGRMEMKDCPESTKAQLAEVRSGKAHPRQYFMHVSEFSDHVSGVMEALNHERNDGKILRGEAPTDKWATAGERQIMPDSAKYLYRSSYSIVLVTRNGVRSTVGSGKYQHVYTYQNEEALEQYRGTRVIVFWNEHNPDTDAVVYTVRNGRPHQFICVASRYRGIDRFEASEAELKAEATRKKLAMNMAVAQSRQLQPYLQRRSGVLPATGAHSDIADRIAAARQASAEKDAAKTRSQQEVRNAGRELTPADVESALSAEPRVAADPAEEFSPDQIADIFESQSRLEHDQTEPQF